MRGFKLALEDDMVLERQTLKWIKKEIRRLPPGRLKYGNNRKAVYVNGIQSQPPTSDMARKIARRNLLEAKRRTIEENLRCQEILLKKYNSYRDDHVLEKMRPVYQHVIELEWEENARRRQAARAAAQEDWGRGNFHTENLIHKNLNGEIFRSKSEIIVDNIYYTLKIPYSYEERIYWPHNAPPQAWDIKESLQIADYYVPDYTCVMPDGTKKHHEHLGMMDKDSYMEHWMKKMILYYWAGVIPGKNLIITADDCRGGIDQQAIMKLLEHEFRQLIGTAR
ncbi:MAG: hypothetical protein IKW01_02625 [Firmicutes bacterium]|nr:hypothetical protein [Bacillota bacterium]